MPPPFFTIITATHNAAPTLTRLLQSLAAQTCRDFIWVAQDGGSSDDTLAIIDAWRDRLPAVSCDSVLDAGIYDAWNKAIARQEGALGHWVLFLGADDLLAAPYVLHRAKEALARMPAEVILGAGDMEQFSEDGKLKRLCRVDVAFDFTKRHHMRMPFLHPALFAAGHVVREHAFDSTFSIAGDYEWVVRVLHHQAQAQALGFVVTRMSLGGASNNAAFSVRLQHEERRILCRHFPIAPASVSTFFLLYCESLLAEPKSVLRRLCSKSTFGQNIWGFLHKLRALCVGDGKKNM